MELEIFIITRPIIIYYTLKKLIKNQYTYQNNFIFSALEY